MKCTTLNKQLFPELLQKLRQYYPDSKKLCGELNCAIEERWKDVHGYKCVVDKWPDFTSVIWLPDDTNNRLEYIKNNHALWSQDIDRLKVMLRIPGLIKWESKCTFAAVSKKFLGVIREVSEENGGTVTAEEPTDLWSVNMDRLKLVPVPDGFTLKSLKADQAHQLVKEWEFFGEGVLEYAKALISCYSSVALYNTHQQLVGVMVECNYGTMGLLQVFSEFRGQGYSKVLVSNLAKSLLESGREAQVLIDTSNTMSVNLHKGLGFTKYEGGVAWLSHVV